MIVPDEGALLLLQIWLDGAPDLYLRTYGSHTTPDPTITYTGGFGPYGISTGLVAASFSAPTMVDGVAVSTYPPVLLDDDGNSIVGYAVLADYAGFKVVVMERFPETLRTTTGQFYLHDFQFGLRFNQAPVDYPYVVARSAIVTGNGDTATLAVPAHHGGDRLFALFVTNGEFSPTSTGWDLVQGVSDGTSNPRVTVLSRIVSSEPATYDFDVSATSADYWARMFVARLLDDIAWYNFASGTTETSLVIPGAAHLGSDKARILTIWANSDTQSMTPDAPLELDTLDVSAPWGVLIATEEVPESVNYSDRTASIGSAAPWTGLGISLKRSI